MNIVVCVKLTPDANDLEIRGDGSISVERAEWIIGGFDLQAMEAGMQIAEAVPGSKVTVLSVGPGQINNSKLKKDVLSRGPDELYMVVDNALKDADTAVTSEVLADAIRKLGQIDLVLFGEGSADLYFQQAGLQVGEKLGFLTTNGVSAIQVEGDHLVIERTLEDEVEVLETPLPAALSVTTDINQPRLPTMKEILKAGKKPIVEWTLADLGLQGKIQNQIEINGTRAPQQKQRKGVMLSGSPEEMVQALVSYLNKEGII